MVTVLSFLPPWKGDGRGTKVTKNMPHLLRTETTPLLQSVLTVAFHACEHLAGRTKEPVSGFSNTSCLGSPLITLRSYNVCHVEGHQATQNKQLQEVGSRGLGRISEVLASSPFLVPPRLTLRHLEHPFRGQLPARGRETQGPALEGRRERSSRFTRHGDAGITRTRITTTTLTNIC